MPQRACGWRMDMAGNGGEMLAAGGLCRVADEGGGVCHATEGGGLRCPAYPPGPATPAQPPHNPGQPPPSGASPRQPCLAPPRPCRLATASRWSAWQLPLAGGQLYPVRIGAGWPQKGMEKPHVVCAPVPPYLPACTMRHVLAGHP